MKLTTRQMLDDAAQYGKRNSGYGFSTSRKITEALAHEDEPDETNDAYAHALEDLAIIRLPSGYDRARELLLVVARYLRGDISGDESDQLEKFYTRNADR